ncbi:MAG: DUF2459 domain-containing protein [Minwuiales bacterium]|nr:DUF2459 domain-containing protein [Minwuiales bacterium]
MTRLFALLALVALAGCAGAPPLPPGSGGPPAHTVYVVSNGWHTAVVLPRPALAETGLLPEADDFPDAAFLEFGWGDRTYYPAEDKTVGMALGAAFTATPAVMHMAGLGRAPRPDGTDREVVPVALSAEGFRRLAAAVAGEFQRPEGGRAAPVSRGLYPNSNFYDAHDTFHLFNTCNTWTARMVRAAGVDISPSGVVMAGQLMTRLRAAVR